MLVQILWGGTLESSRLWGDPTTKQSVPPPRRIKARAKIQAALRRQQRILQRDGEEKLTEFLQKEDLMSHSNNIEKVWKLHKLKSREELLEALGGGI